MIPADDPDIRAHRAANWFYYERAERLEETMMNILCFLNIALTEAVHENRNYVSEEVLAALERRTDFVEAQFMMVAEIIRNGQAFRSLTASQRAVMEAGCLNIRFVSND